MDETATYLMRADGLEMEIYLSACAMPFYYFTYLCPHSSMV